MLVRIQWVLKKMATKVAKNSCSVRKVDDMRWKITHIFRKIDIFV